MIKYFLAILLFISSCSVNTESKESSDKDSKTLLFKSQDSSISFTGKYINAEKTKIDFKLFINNQIEEQGVADLILIEDINTGKFVVPEGTNRIDYTDPNDVRGIPCDSTYSFDSHEDQLSFAMENITKNRMDLYFYKILNKDTIQISTTLFRSED